MFIKIKKTNDPLVVAFSKALLKFTVSFTNFTHPPSARGTTSSAGNANTIRAKQHLRGSGSATYESRKYDLYSNNGLAYCFVALKGDS